MRKKQREELLRHRKNLMLANKKHFIGSIKRERSKHIKRTQEGLTTLAEVVINVTIALLIIIGFLYIVL